MYKLYYIDNILIYSFVTLINLVFKNNYHLKCVSK